MQNALVLGASGMLSGLCVRLLEHDFQVFAVARTWDSLELLHTAAEGRTDRLTTMALDYHDTERLGRWIAHTQLMYGPLDRVFAWIHGDFEAVLDTVDREVFAYRRNPWTLHHIRGSRAADAPYQRPRLSPICTYQEIVLGFVRDHSGSRWLTDKEIVDGIWRASLEGSGRSVVGQAGPSELRPGR